MNLDDAISQGIGFVYATENVCDLLENAKITTGLLIWAHAFSQLSVQGVFYVIYVMWVKRWYSTNVLDRFYYCFWVSKARFSKVSNKTYYTVTIWALCPLWLNIQSRKTGSKNR